MPAGTAIDVPAIPVTYVAGDRSQPIGVQAPEAFARLEGMIPSLRHRKFYGVVIDSEYRACVAIQDNSAGDEQPQAQFTIPAGRYFAQRLTGFVSDPSMIGQAVDELISNLDHDPTRPVVEFYRGHDDLSIRIPVKG